MKPSPRLIAAVAEFGPVMAPDKPRRPEPRDAEAIDAIRNSEWMEARFGREVSTQDQRPWPGSRA